MNPFLYMHNLLESDPFIALLIIAVLAALAAIPVGIGYNEVKRFQKRRQNGYTGRWRERV